MTSPLPATPAAPERDLLRFIVCGSVDDGKSTLIGRLLHDLDAVPDDQLAALERDSRLFGHAGDALDYALLVDGLSAEREQGITIDVAYRYVSTPRRAFIVADAPGHEQHTRNMVTGASTADLAVVLVDARKGVLTQTRRHTCLVSLLGVRSVILAVTKMDLMHGEQAVFDDIVADYRAFAAGLGVERIVAVPVSGLTGDQVVRRGDAMPWYDGPTLIEALEAAPPDASADEQPFRMPVQGVSRPGPDFRGYAGRIVAGRLTPGDAVRIQPSGVVAHVDRIVTFDGDLPLATAGRSVTLTLKEEVDAARGDVLCAARDALACADQFEVDLVWMADDPLLPGRVYDLKIGARTVPAQITDIRHRLNVDTLEPLAARTLGLNAIGRCHLSLGQEIAFAPYAENRDLGGFILIDRLSRATVGAGMIRFALRRAANIHRQPLNVDRETRARMKGQKPTVLWFTGLSGAGKSTVANLVEARLAAMGRHSFLIDGDNLRHGLSRDLGFTDADRVENIRRAAETARMMTDAGLIVLVSLISPFGAERRMARDLMAEGEFIEVFVDTPLAIAEGRDVKGLYAKARRGELVNFTGVDSAYEPPEAPEIRLDGAALSAEAAAEAVIAALVAAGRID